MKLFKLILDSLPVICVSPSADQKRQKELNASNPDYVTWLKNQSMLLNAQKILAKYIGKKDEWQHEFSFPITDKILEKYPVMYTAYPDSTLTTEGQNFLEYYSLPEIWKVFDEIGIKILHTCPIKKSGGLDGYNYTPTIDGYFDRIELEVEPIFGNQENYRKAAEIASENGGIVLADIVPGHTGMGADFLLAAMFCENYPVYTI